MINATIRTENKGTLVRMVHAGLKEVRPLEWVLSATAESTSPEPTDEDQAAERPGAGHSPRSQGAAASAAEPAAPPAKRPPSPAGSLGSSVGSRDPASGRASPGAAPRTPRARAAAARASHESRWLSRQRLSPRARPAVDSRGSFSARGASNAVPPLPPPKLANGSSTADETVLDPPPASRALPRPRPMSKSNSSAAPHPCLNVVATFPCSPVPPDPLACTPRGPPPLPRERAGALGRAPSAKSRDRACRCRHGRGGGAGRASACSILATRSPSTATSTSPARSLPPRARVCVRHTACTCQTHRMRVLDTPRARRVRVVVERFGREPLAPAHQLLRRAAQHSWGRGLQTEGTERRAGAGPNTGPPLNWNRACVTCTTHWTPILTRCWGGGGGSACCGGNSSASTSYKDGTAPLQRTRRDTVSHTAEHRRDRAATATKVSDGVGMGAFCTRRRSFATRHAMQPAVMLRSVSSRLRRASSFSKLRAQLRLW